MADRYHCMLFKGIDTVPSLFWQIFQILLVLGKKYSLSSYCTGPGSQSRFQDLGLVYLEVSYLCITWSWRLFSCSRHSGSSIYYRQADRMVLIQPFPHSYLIFACSYVEFTFCVCRNLYGLIKTEICIISLISSILYR